MALSCIFVSAQTKYYNATKTFYESGYTYQCDVKSKLVTLYNKANKWTYVEQLDKTTGEYADIDRLLPVLVDDDWTLPKCREIVTNAFTYNEALRVQNTPTVTVAMCINSTTGKVEEVFFEFSSIDAFATIPVSVYRKIETDLKSQVWFTPTATGKTLNYIFRWFGGMPKPIAPASTTTSTTPSKPIKPTPPTKN
jgi:hypothetical protein